MQNVFLLHLRESLHLTPEQIGELTGIPVKQYGEYENAASLIAAEDLELLSTLFRVRKEYLETGSRQLHLCAHYGAIRDRQNQKIRRLTDALKRKITKISREQEDRANSLPAVI